MKEKKTSNKLLIPSRKVGIVGYGAYLPAYRLRGEKISEMWTGGTLSPPVIEKAVAGIDEDVVTMSIEASRNTLKRAGISADLIRAVWVGSESHPYAVKPSSTIVAEAIGAVPNTQGADWEFACKAGTEAFIAGMGMVGSEMMDYVLVIGMDTAQARPGDALEYTAASGGAAFIIGPANESIAQIVSAYSYVTDTPDFWRRAYQKYPEHGARFTGEPAYFKHIQNSVSTLMIESGTKPEDYNYAVFHQPNSKFPIRVAKKLGFNMEQIKTGLLAPMIGNTYAGSGMIGLTAILDEAKPGDRILFGSFGSGAGSDTIDLVVTDNIEKRSKSVPSTQDYIDRRVEIDYATYLRYRGMITLK